MKQYVFLLLLAAAMTFSCSSDDDGGGSETPTEDNLVGTWDLTRLEVDDSMSNDDLNFAQEIIDVLVAQDCDLLTLIFAADGSLSVLERDYQDITVDVNAGGTGLSVGCPETQQTETASWSLEGDQLTITFTDGSQETVTVIISGNELTVDAEFVDEDNLSDADAVFTKR